MTAQEPLSRKDGPALDGEPPSKEPPLGLWRLLMLGITVCWGANFAIVKSASDALGDAPAAVALFAAARFAIGSAALSPFLFRSSSWAATRVGLTIGGLCAFGYAAQTAALAMGTHAGTAAFVCSLQAVVVALGVSRKAGGRVAPTTWQAIALAVAGVACLEIPGAVGAVDGGVNGGGLGWGDVLAFGQPVGFGASYVLLEQAMAEHPTDELPLAAIQTLAVCAFSMLSASAAAGFVSPADLPWGTLLPWGTDSGAVDLCVSAALLYTGLVSSALTIWLQAVVFARLPATDSSVILTTEPLWASMFAVVLLGDQLGLSDLAGGTLILAALAANDGQLDLRKLPSWPSSPPAVKSAPELAKPAPPKLQGAGPR